MTLNPGRHLSFDPNIPHDNPHYMIRTHQVVTSQPTDLQHLQSFPTPNQSELTALLYHMSMNAQRQEQRVDQKYQEQLQANTHQKTFNEQFMAYMVNNDKRNEDAAAIQRDTAILQAQLINRLLNLSSDTDRSGTKRPLPPQDSATVPSLTNISKDD